MSVVRRILLFFAAVCCWGAAIASTVSWLCAHIELGEARRTVRIPCEPAVRNGVTLFAASVDMDFCKWRYHRGRVRVLFSMPDGAALRKALESHTIRIRVNTEERTLSMGELYEPYAEMRALAQHPRNCVLAETELDYRRGQNSVTLEMAPALPAYSGLSATLCFPDSSETASSVVIRGIAALFFLLLAQVQTLLFFYGERKAEGRLRTMLRRVFALIPAEFLLALVSVAIWKAWLLGRTPPCPAGLLADLSHGDSPRVLLRLFSCLNLLLFAVLSAGLLLLLAVRLIRLMRKKA